jgi:hypothetical protein
MINLCACIGPVYGEPFCPCEMKDRGLPSSPEHLDAIVETTRRLDELFGPSGKYHKSVETVK